MNIKRLLINCLPYGIVSNWYSYRLSRIPHFIDEYMNYTADIRIEEETESSISSYKNIIAVLGFGYTGSGAVIDLLREFSNVTVLGKIDNEGSKSNKEKYYSVSEQDFLRLSGGLFELEKYINSSNIFHNAAALQRFAAVVEKSSLYRTNNKIKKIFFAFFSHITSIHIGVSHPYYNSYLYDWKKPQVISYLKEMNIAEFREECKKLLLEIADILYQDFHNEYLVMDQLLSDYEFDIHKYKDYIPNLKLICVYRDPRDVYAFANEHNIEWIPRSINNFINWYHIVTKKFERHSTDYLVVRFEDLVNDYENQIERVKSFLGMRQGIVHKQFSCFDPQLSKENVGIWKLSDLSADDFQKIQQELKEYCY